VREGVSEGGREGGREGGEQTWKEKRKDGGLKQNVGGTEEGKKGSRQEAWRKEAGCKNLLPRCFANRRTQTVMSKHMM
jgi:hypothetical protein